MSTGSRRPPAAGIIMPRVGRKKNQEASSKKQTSGAVSMHGRAKRCIIRWIPGGAGPLRGAIEEESFDA
jgi:hypothetical protein